jgi:sialate O-acetylesterase
MRVAKLPGNLDTWVLAGQSNMQGCGLRAGAMPPDERVWCFSSAGEWEAAKEPLHRLWESFTPVHQDLMRPGLTEADRNLGDAELAARQARTDPGGAGLGIAFGKALAGALGRPIGLIPAAHGGTTLEQWNESRKGQGGRSLYGGMLERIRRAGGMLRGILWYQGESDTCALQDGRSYAERFDRWIAAARSDTGIPDLPVLVVQIGRLLEPPNRTGIWPAWDLVREALGTLPGRMPYTAVTSAVDLPLTDFIHVSTEGLIRLGCRLARMALGLSYHKDIPAGPRVAGIERATLPGGGRNALRIRFSGLTGRWVRKSMIPGFELREQGGEYSEPLFVIEAQVDDSAGDNSILLLLNREPGATARLGYGLGLDPRCDLVDEADMPLCSFLPRPIDD